MIAIYAGSFDPFTNGHLDIVRRASKLFDRVVVALGDNEAKNYVFPSQEREDMVRLSCAGCENVSVLSYPGRLLMEVAEEVGADVILRGVRSDEDRDYEANLFEIHRMWNPEIETLVMFPDPSVAKISSTFVKQVANYEGSEIRLQKMVPLPVLARLTGPVPPPSFESQVSIRTALYDAMSYFPNVCTAHVEEWVSRLQRAYRDPSRSYHDTYHIETYLGLVYEHWRDGRWSKPEAFPAAIMAALWHDYIYDTGSEDNEERSFEAFEEFWEGVEPLGSPLNVDVAHNYVWNMILGTRHLMYESSHGNPDWDLFVDCDLNGFALDYSEFRQQSSLIRHEYGQFSDEVYWTGRAQFLEAFSKRPTYFSPFYRSNQSQSRDNIQTELRYARYRASGGEPLPPEEIQSLFEP